MTQGLGLCEICHRQLLDNGQCLFCTTSEALDLRQLVPDAELKPPEPSQVITLVELTTGQRHPLEVPRVRIGRDPKNQIVINDDVYVSRHHAFITFEDGKWWLEDLGSKNGTLLNYAHILDRELIGPGDVVTIGRTEFRVE